MQIDGNPNMMESIRLIKAGENEKGIEIQDAFLAEIEGKNICSCPNTSCYLHGDCKKCVAVHRGHRDHIPCCFFSMLDERIEPLLQLTEKKL